MDLLNLKIGAASLNQTALDWEGNEARIVAALHAARADGVQILCLPELVIPSYGCEDAFLSVHVAKTCEKILLNILPHTKSMVVAFGLPVLYGKHVFSTACLVADGTIVGFVAKHILPGDGIHYEPRWFRPWPIGIQASVNFGGGTYPIGDLYFDIGGVHIGIEICEDAWSPQRYVHRYAGDLDVILNPSASHFAFDKFKMRERIVEEGSRAFGVAYAYANLMGNDAGRVIYDGGCIIAAHGHVVERGARFSFRDHDICSAIIDIDRVRTEFTARGTSFKVTEQHRKSCVDYGFQLKTVQEVPTRPSEQPGWESGAFRKEEEFARAVTLGMLDYLRKSRADGFVVSLSGGADSASVTALCDLMVRLAVDELGVKGFKDKLSYIPGIESANTCRELLARLLTCVYQRTSNNSQETRQAARTLAEGVGAEFLDWDVEPLVKQYEAMVSASLARELSWEKDDLARQNIQARVRSPGVWLVANLKRAILLNTSNRSEAAVGYTTMDGDSSGGLNPIGGIDKNFLIKWLAWTHEVGLAKIGKVPGLELVTKLSPTAELRPLSRQQRDEDDLMPYAVLDKLEEWAIRDKGAPVDVLSRLKIHFPEYSKEVALRFVDKFFSLWAANQWKRERLAPSFHLDDTNLDPKTWCRFPILSGGFRSELRALRDGETK